MINLDNKNEDKVNVHSATSEELPINAMARVVIQLGEQLIENEVAALLEIIKNSYDADANNVFIEINTVSSTNLGQGFITIRDNGNGMNKDQIKNGFLLISTINKTEKSGSKRHDRVPLGEKGVGRLSTQRLATFLNLRTKGWQRDEEYLLSIDWNKFHENVLLGNITAFLDTNQFSLESFNSNDDIHILPYLPRQITDDDFGFTELTLVGLNNINFWNQKDVDKIIGHEVLRLISPFKKNDSIGITIELTNEHHNKKIIKTESIDEEFLENAAMYKVEFSFKYPILTIDFTFNPMFYKRLEGKDSRANLPLNYETNHIPVDINHTQINILNSNDKLKNQLKKTVKNNSIDFANPGDFKGILFIYNYAIEQQINEFYDSFVTKFPGLFQKDKDVKEFLKSTAGVKIYRDMFRILPYGNHDNDWLGLTRISQTMGSFFAPKVANTIGYVEIKSINNKDLKEMTNRQGFILDAFGENFLAICRESAVIASREVRRQTDVFGQQYPRISNASAHDEADDLIIKTTNDVKEVLIEAQKIADRISEKINNKQVSLFQDAENDDVINQTGSTLNDLVVKTLNISNSLQKASDEIKAAKRLYDYSKEEVAPLLELSALGVIAEALTHELHKSINNTRIRAQKIQKSTENGLKSDNTRDLMEVLKMTHGEARLIEAESNSIERQVRHLAPGFRQRRRSVDKIVINKEINNIYIQGVMAERAEKNGIKINIFEEGNLTIKSSLGMIIQVFDNLYINSEYWLQYFEGNREIEKMDFNILISSRGSVKVWDSGLGIDPIIENRIFLPFESQKENGRGLGLYIVSSILDFNESTIRLLPERNRYNRKYIFEIDFTKVII